MNKTLRRSQRIAHIERVIRELEWLLKDAPHTDGSGEDHDNLSRRLGDTIAAFDFALNYNKAAMKRETNPTPAPEAPSASAD